MKKLILSPVWKKHIRVSVIGPVLRLLVLFLLLPSLSSGQDLRISSGTSLFGSGGDIVVGGNIVNNGSFINRANVVIFAGTIQSLGGAAPAVFENMRIRAGSTTTINTLGQTLSGILKSDGNLIAGGNITLLSVPGRTALIDGSGTGQVTGDLIMQRYLPIAFGYKYFSSPFQGSTVSEFGDDMNLLASFPSFYRYDESRVTAGWVNYTNPVNILNPMEGYAVNFGNVLASGTVDIKGTVNNGPLSVTLYNHNNTYTTGFNLVGNPYPSPFDWNAASGWTKNNIDNAIYFFKSGSTDEYVGTYSTYIDGVSSDGEASNIIPSMQGFFIHVSDGTYPVTGTLGMNNAVRVTDQVHPFIKSGANSDRSLVRLEAGYSDDAASFDPLVIYFEDKATFNFEGQFDALKMFNTDYNVTNFYSFGADGSKLSINALPLQTDTIGMVRLGINIPRDGEIIFRIKLIQGELSGNTVIIYDSISDTRINLFPDKDYRVKLVEGGYTDRFYLDFNEFAITSAVSPEDQDLLKIYSARGSIVAEVNTPVQNYATLRICNLLGQTLFLRRIYESGHHEFRPSLDEGIYLVKFTNENSTSSKKIFFRKY